VTGLYTVLVEGDDLEDPIADSTRAILDGHIVLSRKLANRGHYPSVDILSSVSRVMDKVASPEQVTLARKMKELLARYQDNEDAINYGMYLKGSDLNIDEAIDRHPLILDFLKQARENSATLEHSLEQMRQVFS
jgi:flagellum-specific ATP synthase